MILGILPGLTSSRPTPVELKFWGFEDDEGLWDGITRTFEEKYPYIKISYKRLDENNYEDILVNKLAEGSGPDVFFLKNSWLTKHGDKIYPLPQDYFRYYSKNFRADFVDVTEKELITADSSIIGLPLFVDTLALFYNKDIFNQEGIAKPPTNWEEVIEISRRLTKTTPTGDIIRSGIPLGSLRNIDHAFEILSSLILQNGDSIIGRDGSMDISVRTKEAIEFFISFADPVQQNFSWSARLPDSLDAFADGNATMAFGFSSDIKRIKSKNPHLNFGIVSFPKAKDAASTVTYGKYFFPAVSRLSKYPGQSWQFILFAASEAGAEIYKNSDKPPARRDLISAGTPEQNLDVFYRQTLTAANWPIPEERATVRIFQEVVDGIMQRSLSLDNIINLLSERLGLLMK